MASSDNVLRGGLTARHVDVDELLAVLDTTPGPVPLVTPVPGDDVESTTRVPVPDFALSRLALAPAGRTTLPTGRPQILLVLDGRARGRRRRRGRVELARGRSASSPPPIRRRSLHRRGDGVVATTSAPVPGVDAAAAARQDRRMSTSGGTRAIIAALLANTGIAVTKFVAFLLTQSSSMLAESIHSVADAGNQGLLLLGGRRARRAGVGEAPVRLRPRALHLRVHRVDRAVQRRRAVRAVRGVAQAPGPAPDRRLALGAGRACWSPRSSWSRFSFRTAIVESNHVRGDAVVGGVHPARQGAGAAR